MSAQLPWYVARAAGIVAWALLAGSVGWGLAMTTQTFKRRVRRPWLLDLHRFLGGLALIFTAVHVTAIVADTYVHFGLAEVLVPLAAKWHPVGVAFGIVGIYLLAAVEATSLLRNRIPNALWRKVHFLSFPLYVVTTIHLLTAGTDRGNPLLLGTVIVSTAAVLGLVAMRVSRDQAAAAPAHGTVAPRSTPPGRAPIPAGVASPSRRPTTTGAGARPSTPDGQSSAHRHPQPAGVPARRDHR
jgi:methionine sulfoxide reductase heme-binding subunit